MAATLEATAIMQEVKRILESTTTLTMRHITAMVHCIDANISIEAIKVTNVDIIRDYENNFADTVSISLIFPAGTYFDILYPNKENIELSIKSTPITKDKKDNVKKEDEIETRYIAKIVDSNDHRVQPSTKGISSTDTLDITNMIEVNFQLIEKDVFLMKMVEVGAISRQVTPKEFLETFLTLQTSNLQIAASEKIIGIDLIEPDNNAKQEHIVIPHGTPLITVPEYIQNKVCGIYNYGLLSYIQSKVWYIYPRHNIDRSPKGNRYITILVIPTTVLPSIQKTWRKDGEHYKILCTGRLNMTNQANVDQLSFGTGVRYTSSVKPLTEEYPSRGGNKAILSKETINTENLGNKLKGKEQSGPYRSNYFTQNGYREASMTSALNFGILNCFWENSIPRIIEPGTLAKILYLDPDGTVLDLKGTILMSQTSTYLPKQGMMQNTWVTNTNLVVLVKNNLDGNGTKQVKGGAVGWIKGAGSAGGGVGGSSSISHGDLFG